MVTLTTDFGLKDPFVGVMKGQLAARFPAVRIIDLTHEIPAHWPAEAGFWLARSFRYFPAGTVHVAVVDPGVGSAREIAAIEADGHLFLAPDNGLLTLLFQHLDPVHLRNLPADASEHIAVKSVFAGATAHLASGKPPARFAPTPGNPWPKAPGRSWPPCGMNI